MKKHALLVTALLIGTLFSASAETSVCLSLQSNSLKLGSRDTSINNDVSKLQEFLASNGFLSSPVTGYYGEETVIAVKAFQKYKGIPAVGNFGPATRAAINGDSCVFAARDARAAASLAVNEAVSAPVIVAQASSGSRYNYDTYLGGLAEEASARLNKSSATLASGVAKTIGTVNAKLTSGVSGVVATLSGVRSASAQQAGCVNLKYSLHRGNESATVKKLQDFLYQKGFLSESPTGFFGDMTIAAVKAYQNSVGIKETGMVFDLTRQMIKAETCAPQQ